MIEIVIKNSDHNRLCFNHAVKAVMEKGEVIDITAYDDKDCGASGAWFLGGCVECFPPDEEGNKE